MRTKPFNMPPQCMIYFEFAMDDSTVVIFDCESDGGPAGGDFSNVQCTCACAIVCNSGRPEGVCRPLAGRQSALSVSGRLPAYHVLEGRQ